MTTISSTSVTCCICGEESEQEIVLSTNQSGAPDLDGRPPEMYRSTMPYWIMTCPHCGVTQQDISKCPDGLLSVIGSAEYINHVTHLPTESELAWRFLTLSYTEEKLERYDYAALRALHAAWTYDDHDFHDHARSARGEAARLIEIANSHEQTIHDEEHMDQLIRADLFRRKESYGDAKQILLTVDKSQLPPSLQQIYDYQYSLIEELDCDCHTTPSPTNTPAPHSSTGNSEETKENPNTKHHTSERPTQLDKANSNDNREKSSSDTGFIIFFGIFGAIIFLFILSGTHPSKMDDVLIISGAIALIGALYATFSKG